MSDAKFACPQCSQHLEAPPEMVGSVIACPTCEKQIQVPQPIPAQSPPPLPPIGAPKRQGQRSAPGKNTPTQKRKRVELPMAPWTISCMVLGLVLVFMFHPRSYDWGDALGGLIGGLIFGFIGGAISWTLFDTFMDKLCRCRHKWSGCKCIVCNEVRHTWNACKCTVCNTTRNEGHVWNGCKCTVCNRTRHTLVGGHGNGCRCSACGDVFPHIWKNHGTFRDEDGNTRYELLCRRCGTWTTSSEAATE